MKASLKLGFQYRSLKAVGSDYRSGTIARSGHFKAAKRLGVNFCQDIIRPSSI
jgi:hypothetical protein